MSNTSKLSSRRKAMALAASAVVPAGILGGGTVKATDALSQTDAERIAKLESRFAQLSKRYDELTNDVNSLSNTRPPIGSVTMWWGDRSAIPDGGELCDGKEVETSNAVLRGVKPNFIDRFHKGAIGDRKSIAELVKRGMRGSNNMPPHFHSPKLLVIGPDGGHTHTIKARSARGDREGDVRDAYRAAAREVWSDIPNAEFPTASVWVDPDTKGEHSHNVTGRVGSEEARVDGDADNSGANQPAYSEIFFVIRVK
jgi:hypothetical protein